MPTTVTAPDIVRGEDRICRVDFGGASFPTGAASWVLSLVITQAEFGSAVVTVAFGASEYSDEGWDVTISAANTALLTAKRNSWITVRRTDSGFNTLLGYFKVTVG